MAPREDQPILIVLGTATEGLIAHELAHAYLHITDEATQTSTPQRHADRRGVLAMAKMCRPAHVQRVVINPRLREERQAAALAEYWGFRGHHTHARWCAETTERTIWREAERAYQEVFGAV